MHIGREDLSRFQKRLVNALRRDRSTRDAAIIFGLSLIALALAVRFELFEQFYDLSRAHNDWELDELFSLFMVMAVGGLAFSIRRLNDLSREVRARRKAEDEAAMLARHDPLTGLPNRRFFGEQLNGLLKGELKDCRSAILLLDLDGFKAINDVHGHASGDLALIEFAARVSTLLPSGALLARIGGDEFAIIQPRIASIDDAAALARHVVAAVAEPFVVGNHASVLGVGIGITIAPDNGTDPESLVRRADLALYRAKREGWSSIRFFEREMDEHVERRAVVERALRTALSVDAVDVYFQPIVQLESNRIIGFEALARWTSSELGAVPPNIFIDIAEECGLIHNLGDQLLRKACNSAACWPRDLTLSFNISPVQLRDQTLGLRLLSILAETGLDPRRLQIEITESALVRDVATARRIIDDLRSAGVRVALDDFGTGYATMSQLIAMRFDKIKIDRSFVQRLGKDEQSDVIVRATLGLAHGLGLVTTAEGIEDAHQLARLRETGCVEGQGYLLGRPVSATQALAMLQAEHGADNEHGAQQVAVF